MVRYAVLLLLMTLVVWRFAPKVRVTWLAVVTLFVLVVAVRAAAEQWA